jgi:DNA-binding HxlR family transcriptional regulator
MASKVDLPVWRQCDVSVTLDVIGGRWKAVILFSLLAGARRYSEIQRLLPGVAQKTLTAQLRELEADGIVTRHIYPSVPPKVEYSLTDVGGSLEGVLIALRHWGGEHRPRLALDRQSGS